MPDFMPHGFCLKWDPALIWFFIAGNVMVAISYFSIPASLVYFIKKHASFTFNWVLGLFAGFIFLCGTTHLMKIWTFWRADYWAEASLDFITGLVSLVTAIALWRLIPKAIEIFNAAQIAQKNEATAAIVGSSNDGIISKSLDGKVITWNRAAETIYGWEAEEIIGQSINTIIPEDRIDESTNIVKKILKGDKVENFETIRKTKDNRLIDISLNASPIKNKKDEIIAISVTLRDISHQKEILKLKKLESKFRGLLESAPDAMVIVNEKNKIVLVNAKTEHLFGYEREELIGEEINILIPNRYKSSHKQKTKDYFMNPSTRAMGEGKEIYGMKKDGSEFPAEISLAPLKTDEGLLVSSVIRDVTERNRLTSALEGRTKELEETTAQLKIKNAELDQFNSIAAHDLREPLRVIRGFTELLEQSIGSKLNEEEKEYFSFVNNSGHRMQVLIDDLLEFSRVGKVEATRQPCNLADVIETAKENLLLTITESNTTIEVESLPPVMASQKQLVQVFQNLISNAIKFKSDQNPVISINGKVEEDFLIVSVKDNGIGISEEYQEQIFQPFKRLHSAEDIEGSGIGLALIKKIMTFNKGDVWLRSQVGKGSTFYLKFQLPESR